MGYGQRWMGVLFFCLSTIIASPVLTQAAVLRLNWQDTSSTETGFKVERLSGSTYVEIASVAANIVSYSDSNLTAGSTYCYRVRAFNSAGTSAPTNAACTTAPAGSTGAVAVNSTTSSSSGSTGTTTPATNPPTTPAPTTATGDQWTDYLVSAKIRSADNDALGLMFRYQDKDNYYRFSWFAEGKTRRLEKRVAGVFHVLAQDNAVYTTGQTYAVEISARGSSLSVAVDGKTIFTVSDASLSRGTIGLYSYYNTGSYFSDVRVQDLVTGNDLLADNFSDGDHVGWTAVDEGNDAGPSVWKVVDGTLAQSSNIGSNVSNGWLGTYALYTRGSWSDYRVSLKLRSSDDDRLGVMFRVQDKDNFYRLSWNKGTPGRSLWKRDKGTFTLLAQDAVPYVTNQTHSLEIIAQGNSLKVTIDGKSVFSVTDESFKTGTVALYSSYNQSSFFDDVLVENLATKQPLLWDDFNDGNLAGWKVFDDPGTTLGPSNWSVSNGALSQTTNIGSDATGHPGTFLLY